MLIFMLKILQRGLKGSWTKRLSLQVSSVDQYVQVGSRHEPCPVVHESPSMYDRTGLLERLK